MSCPSDSLWRPISRTRTTPVIESTNFSPEIVLREARWCPWDVDVHHDEDVDVNHDEVQEWNGTEGNCYASRQTKSMSWLSHFNIGFRAAQ